MSKRKINIESGYQIAKKIAYNNVAKVCFLDQHIFPFGGPYNGQVVEITGEACGKSMLILEMIARAILPEEFGGQNVGAIVFDCDGKMVLAKLMQIMDKYIRRNYTRGVINDEVLDYLKGEAIKRLQLIYCFDYSELRMELINLTDTLIDDPDNVFIFIDGLASLYWTIPNRLRIDTYIKNLQQKFRKITHDSRTIIVYTRSTSFVSPESNEEATSGTEPWHVDHKIELMEVNDGKFMARYVNKKQRTAVKRFEITNSGISWNK
jgi:hypothetical protein